MAEGDDAKTFRETLYVKKSLLAAVVVIQAFALAVIGGGLWAWSNHAGAAVPVAQAGGAAQKSLHRCGNCRKRAKRSRQLRRSLASAKVVCERLAGERTQADKAGSAIFQIGPAD